MVGIISLLVALTLSLIVTRVAAMALMFTGLSRESARFQARSAFTGVGFTTTEAEQIVNHPVRRRIVMLLMLLGNVGVATVAGTVMVSFLRTEAASWRQQLVMLLSLTIGLLLLWLVSRSRWIERRTNHLIALALRRFSDLDVRDYVALLELSRGYVVTEMVVEPGDWLEGRQLAALRLSDEGILVLSIRRADDSFIGTPRGIDSVHRGDVLILYGDVEDIEKLDRRRAGVRGDQEHRRSVAEQELWEEQERQRVAAAEAAARAAANVPVESE